MKERFAKLLLGEDMSGGGKGVCTALAVSNAITNLSGLSLPPYVKKILVLFHVGLAFCCCGTVKLTTKINNSRFRIFNLCKFVLRRSF